MLTDDQLLALVHRFEESALVEVYDRYSPGIYRYAVRLLGDVEQAEECVAETFSRFLVSLKHGNGPRRHLRAYLYRVAHNWITDQYRRQPVILPLEAEWYTETGDNPDAQVSEAMEREQVLTAIAMLTPEQRQVIVLKFLEGWQNDEIASAIEKPVGAVKALQHRAVNTLRRLLQKAEEVA